MRRTLGVVVLGVLLASPLAAANLGELFQKAKGEVKNGSWAEALKTFDALDAASRGPGLEAQRAQLEPALAFYRGVCFANLDRPADAKAQFESYLAVNPNASVDRGMYSKKVVNAFETAQRAKKAGEETTSGSSSLAAAYRDFRMTETRTADAPGEAWADGPVKALLTPEEKRQWAGLSDSVSRSEFVTKFWGARDPKPETPQNEFRQEFEKRVAFADAHFAQDETRGSLTDRGTVFILLGPPTYAGRKPIGAGEDTTESQGTSSVGRHDADIAIANLQAGSGTSRGVTSGQKAALSGSMSGPGVTARDASNAWREVWHYRRELLPASVPYQQVDFDFITRKGYGTNVLQRDSNALTTLEAARQKMRALASRP
jgi:GWxTD domain-containing protein